MSDDEFLSFMSRYSQTCRDSLANEFILQSIIFEHRQREAYGEAKRELEVMSLSEKARRYAVAAKDAMVEYACGFVNDPLGSVGDLALDTAYLAGDLATPGGIDAPLRLCRGETSLGQAMADQGASIGAETACGFVLGKICRVVRRLGPALMRGEKTLTKAVVEKIAHKNSLTYRGDTHVYKILGEDGVYKIGESAQGLSRFKKSKRAEMQARRLYKQTGAPFETEIIATFPGKREARAFETQLIQEARIIDPKALPGNKGVH
jgi:hypothetical protein